MTGHVQIDGREYMLANVNSWRKSTPTPMAAKQTSGKSEYSDFDDRDAWDMQNWEAGLGQLAADAGGFSFAVAETRYPERITLPREFKFARNGSNGNPSNLFQPGDVNDTTYLRSAVDDKIAVAIVPSRSAPVPYCYVWLDLDADVTVDVSFYKDDEYPYDPTTVVETTTVTGDGSGPHWYKVVWETDGGIGSTWDTYAKANNQYWIVIDNPSEDIRVPAYNGLYSTNTAHWFYDGNIADWVVVDKVLAFAVPAGEGFGGIYYGDGPHMVYFSGETLAVTNGAVFRWTGTTQNWVPWALFSPTSAGVKDTEVWGGYLWVAMGSKLIRIDESGTKTEYTLNVTTLAAWRFYLYRGYQNDLYYTANPDSPTWDSAGEIGPDNYEIRGMAGLNANELYISTDYAFFVYTDTGLIESPNRWPVIDSGNGVGMVNHQGVLYIPIGQTVYQYDGGSLLPMGPDREEGLPAEYAGDVLFVYSTNQWLFCAVEGLSRDAIFAWNGQGWHLVADMPQDTKPLTMCYSPEDKHLYVGVVNEILRLYQPDRVQVPERDTSTRYMPYGYIDFPWFYSGLRLADKTFYNVKVDGDNLSSTSYVKIWWQDSDSTGWELLGTVTSVPATLYWTVSQFPSTTKLRLRATLHTEDNATSPVVKAIVVEYRAQVRDRYQWTLPILVTNDQELWDGSKNPQTFNNMVQHLDGLRSGNAPFGFRDIDGQEWVVEWNNQTAQLDQEGKPELMRNRKRRLGMVYSVVLNEITTG